jgi:ubiquinone/menaquinone biosynthesis C-methylase UbiE
MKKLDRKYFESYSKEALIYNEKRFSSPKGRFSKELKNHHILDILNKNGSNGKDCSIIDIASGTGRVVHELAKKNFKHIIASDMTGEMLKINQKNLNPGYSKKITFVQADMKAMPFIDKIFDVAIVASFFYLIPLEEYNNYIRDIYRILKPGGIVICEIANAFHLINPKSFLTVNFYKHILKKKVKSYLYPWALKKIFNNFSLLEVRGIHFPFITSKINPKLPYFFSESRLFKYFGGQFIAVYRKR